MDELALPRTGHPLALVRGVIEHLVAIALPHPTDPPEAVRPPALPDRLPVRGSDPDRPELYLIDLAAGYKRLVRCPCLLARLLGGRCRVRDQALVDEIPDGPPVLCGSVPVPAVENDGGRRTERRRGRQ